MKDWTNAAADSPAWADIKPIPQQRIIQKLNEYMGHRDYAGAERHLCYWREEAKLGRDDKGLLMVLGELVGHYRKTEEEEKAISSAEEALALLKKMDFEESLSAATTYINIATAYQAFGRHEKAMPLFRKARKIYEGSDVTQPQLLGGLYNNMALTCVSLKQWDEAFSLYEKAMAEMAKVPGGELEQAITCLNMANAVEDQSGLEEGESRICKLLDQASELLSRTTAPHDGYYAFVCEKCAPTFEYYGYFLDAGRLREEAARIYAQIDAEEQ